MGKYRATDVASWIIIRSRQAMELYGGDKLSLLKLLKLLYYAEGCSMASGNGSLFDEDIIAWEHGPVVRSVWEKYHNNPYDLECTDDDFDRAGRIAETDQDILEGVYETFGVYSAWGLREKTHREDPWMVTTNNGKELNGVIDRELIREYFKKTYVAS